MFDCDVDHDSWQSSVDGHIFAKLRSMKNSRLTMTLIMTGSWLFVETCFDDCAAIKHNRATVLVTNCIRFIGGEAQTDIAMIDGLHLEEDR
jgi:hypothetical protein